MLKRFLSDLDEPLTTYTEYKAFTFIARNCELRNEERYRVGALDLERWFVFLYGFIERCTRANLPSCHAATMAITSTRIQAQSTCKQF